MRYYAGIGSRHTPVELFPVLTETARQLEERGWHLRSGGADGADTAFAAGASSSARTIFVPWAGFNDLRPADVVVAPSLPNWREALAIAERNHPAWDNCSWGARKLLGRNTYQILGQDLVTPVELVICWTRGAKGGGGTGQALRVARSLPKPPLILDLADPSSLNRVLAGDFPD